MTRPKQPNHGKEKAAGNERRQTQETAPRLSGDRDFSLDLCCVVVFRNRKGSEVFQVMPGKIRSPGYFVACLDWLLAGNRPDKPVASALNRLYEPWLLGIVPQGLPYLPNRPIDAVVGIEKGVFAPDSFGNLFAGYKLAPALNQAEQDLGGDPFQPQRPAPSLQLQRMGVELEVFPKLQEFAGLGAACRHWPPLFVE
jgi:hypothetical protein